MRIELVLGVLVRCSKKKNDLRVSEHYTKTYLRRLGLTLALTLAG
jgi:hypothetical protein